MKLKTPTLFLIICLILATALLLSVISLVSAKSDVAALEEQIRTLEDQNHQLTALNQTLQAQIDAQSNMIQTVVDPVDTEDFYCTLVVDTWEVKDSTLTVHTFAQAVLAESVKSNAQIELWRGETVLASQPIALDLGEADGVFEADASVSFELPEIEADEELQLWLMVEPAGSDALFACGAGWYLEDGQLMIITG